MLMNYTGESAADTWIGFRAIRAAQPMPLSTQSRDQAGRGEGLGFRLMLGFPRLLRRSIVCRRNPTLAILVDKQVDR